MLGTVPALGEFDEYIENTCPSDPTFGGKCALVEEKSDGYSCREIDGQEVCRDWWVKTYKYRCSGKLDLSSLEGVFLGKKYCSYEKKCTNWVDVEAEGGEVSCRIYFNMYKPGCADNPYQLKCLSNDCGDLFDKCTLKQFVPYEDIPDKANMEAVYYCDPVSGMCGVQQVPGSSGVRVGVYTFDCPKSVRKVCTSWEGEIKCPDGTTQSCNVVRVCKSYETVKKADATELKSCIAYRSYTEYLVEKNSSQEEELKSKENCIKIGEANSDEIKTFTIIGGWDADGGSKNCFYATGWTSNCYQLSEWEGSWNSCWDLLSQESALVNYLNYVYYKDDPVHHVVEIESYATSKMANYSGCFGSDNDDTDVYIYINAKVRTYYDKYVCYYDTVDESNCNIPSTCKRISPTSIDEMDCWHWATDADIPMKKICDQYTVMYECPSGATSTECTEYEEKLVCNNGIVNIPDVEVESKDFTADFSKAMAMAQMANELKHIWSGTSRKCESGWWNSIIENPTDYFVSKAVGFAVSQLGSAVASYAHSYFSAASYCLSYGDEYGDSAMSSGLYQSVGDCMYDVAQDIRNSSTEENPFLDKLPLGDKLQFLQDPVVSFAIGVAVDLITSFDKCNSCTSESCATAHGQYIDYSLISNGLCHLVGSKCAWKIPILGCLRRAYRYCCYDSKFARILVEQAYQQLGYSWGDFDHPNCSQITWDDLKRLDFEKMDFSELIKALESKVDYGQLMDSDSIKSRIEEFYEGSTPIVPDATNPNYKPE
jgi:hypothetical protein